MKAKDPDSDVADANDRRSLQPIRSPPSVAAAEEEGVPPTSNLLRPPLRRFERGQKEKWRETNRSRF